MVKYFSDSLAKDRSDVKGKDQFQVASYRKQKKASYPLSLSF